MTNYTHSTAQGGGNKKREVSLPLLLNSEDRQQPPPRTEHYKYTTIFPNYKIFQQLFI